MTKGVPIVREPNAISRTVAMAREAFTQPVTMTGACAACASQFSLAKLGPLPHLLSDPNKVRRSALARGSVHNECVKQSWLRIHTAWKELRDESDLRAFYRNIYHDVGLRIDALNLNMSSFMSVHDRGALYAMSILLGSYLYLRVYDLGLQHNAHAFISGLPGLHHDILRNRMINLGGLFQELSAAISCSMDPIVRFFALYIVKLISLHKTRSDHDYRSIDDKDIEEALVVAAGDSEHAIAYEAWKSLNYAYPHVLMRVYTSWEHSTPLPRASHTYLHAAGLDRAARNDLLRHLEYDMQHEKFVLSRRVISLDSIIPIHSLADYQPDEELQKPIMQRRYDAIKAMVNEDKTNPDEVLAMALNASDQPIAVVELSSAERYLLQGHHRMAALYKAARDGVIPHSWLFNLPLKVGLYTGDIPNVLFKRIITLGVNLTWDDLLPPKFL